MKRLATKRVAALALVLVMVLSHCPIVALATTGNQHENHSNCGVVSCEESHGCSGADSWQELTISNNSAGGTLDGGSYYLSENITLTGAITIIGPVNLCLNGHTLTCSADWGEAIIVGENDSLVICDCSGSDCGAIVGDWYGITCEEGAKVTVYGGTIRGSTGILAGEKDVTITVNGGAVCGDSKGIDAGNGKGTIYLSGAPNISGTTAGIKVSTNPIIINGVLANTAPISVTMTSPGVFATDWDTYMDNEEPSAYFSSALDGYRVAIGDDGNLKLQEKPVQTVPTVTAPTAKTLTYNGSAQELVNAGSTTGGTMKYALGCDGATAPASGFEVSIPKATDAGTYYVWYYVDGGDAYADSEKVCVSVDIDGKSVDPAVTLSSASFTYNGNMQRPTLTVKDGDATLQEDVDYTIEWHNDCVSVGTQHAAVTLKGNYTGRKAFTYVISYIVVPQPFYVINGAVRDSDGKYYAKHTVKLIPPTGYQIAAELGGMFGTEISFGANDTTPTKVYLRRDDGMLSDAIDVAEVFIFDGTAPVITGVSDGQNHYGATTFAVTDENLLFVTVDGNTVMLTDGKYTIQPDNGIHTITAVDKAGNNAMVTATVSKHILTVTANDHTITYGDEPADNGVRYQGFVDGEDERVLGGTLRYAYNYTRNDGVGSYTITPSGLTSDTYDILFVPGTLTVQQREIGINWGNTAFVYDGSLHAPLAEPDTVIGSDTITLTVAGARSDAGTYTATATDLSGHGAENYKLSGTNTVRFTIAKAAQRVPATVGKTDETITEKNDGTITGVDSTMEYRKDGEATYTAITGDTVVGLPDGKYFVRYKANANHNASDEVAVVIAAGKGVSGGGYPIWFYPVITPEAAPVEKPVVPILAGKPTAPPAVEMLPTIPEKTEPVVPDAPVEETPAEDDHLLAEDADGDRTSGAGVWIVVSITALLAIILLLAGLVLGKKHRKKI